MTGDSTNIGQLNRLDRLVHVWQNLAAENRDIVLLGDANLCALSWLDPDYRHKDLAKTVTDFLAAESWHQLVKEYTRCQKFNNSIHRSCLDHAITNVPDKCSAPVIQGGGSSDHMTVSVTKFSREVRNQPRTIKKRSYNYFDVVAFFRMHHILQDQQSQ